MNQKELLSALNRLKVQTGSHLACLGCGHEHKCSTKGCAILRQAIAEIERLEKERDIAVRDIRLCIDCDFPPLEVVERWAP